MRKKITYMDKEMKIFKLSNNKRKGDRWELRAKKLWETRGYDVEKVRKTKRFSGDFFGCADLICFCRGDVTLVAVTNIVNKNRAVKKLKNFLNHPEEIRKIALIYQDRKGWVGEIEV